MATTKELIEKINSFFSDGNMEAFMDYAADDMVWEMYSSTTGHTTLNGREAINSMEMPPNMPEKMEFKFDTIVIEGDIASVQGSSSGTRPDGKPYKGHFCDVYHFKNDKIAKMVSYVIDSE
ncbi:nuclear transport factor 2 family protein [Mucilaginibacter myungsuensis]|uniref:Nuclear transport factor 2 family protein n=1 Tax=Mucilaginibacter myungsuensis TaxID=649104 RepID=A0A929L1K0_9SPHI|nr:nuclear transport factor 2 family protein [Mucilaginibacter myungsuensis]MBE9663923.1 nuclear transport factor 2 family protein [Mucilaginibacter myungsuensis]MDN3598361.1 nuclear transport factor 2 family protein [Mucilaginibacter myungsuensis]